jgi:hypothetical protein
MFQERRGRYRQFNVVLFGELNDFQDIRTENGTIIHRVEKRFKEIKIALFDFFQRQG